MQTIIKKAVGCLLTLAILATSCMLPVTAETAPDQSNAFGGEDSGFAKSGGYGEYLKLHGDADKPLTPIIMKATQNVSWDGQTSAEIQASLSGKENVLYVKGAEGRVSWTFTAENAGLYCFQLDYLLLNETASEFNLELYLDGQIPFSSASELVFARLYENAGTITTDNHGNDIRPQQETADCWMSESASDSQGVENDPFAFYLSKGVHTLTLRSSQSDYAISQLEFYNDKALPDYASYAADARITDGSYFERIQAEDATFKSSSVLYPTYDRSGVDTYPSDPVKLRLNTIGGSNYSKQGQFLVWNVSVPQSGYYKLSMRVRQNVTQGMTSYRRLYIDGSVPFVQANAIAFPFNDDWQEITLGDEQGDWLFYLQEGTNELKLEVVPGDSAEISASLGTLAYSLNYMYRKIIMITGVSPDAYRDYQLETQLPGLLDAMQSLEDEAENILSAAQQLGNDTTGNLSDLERLSVLLKNLIKNPDTIATRISRFRDCITAVSDLILKLQNQPLELDYLTVSATEGETFYPSSNVWNQFFYSLDSFLGSFTSDYNSIGDTTASKDVLDVWVNLGRDQAQVLKTLVDSSFTPQTGIVVNVSLVQQSLVQATLSGSGPDVVLFVGQSDPINLAARNALVELDSFDSFDEVTDQFSSEAMTPYAYNGHEYALPLTENFSMMFYRTDIFDELNLTVPTTWDEFYNVIRVLQRNNMTVGIPNMPSNTQMQADISIFATLIKQNGGTFYQDDLTATNFTSETSVAAFEQWTSFYSDYGLPYQFDFYNRFRSGEMPIGISGYTLYNQFMSAAPEIRGLWEMVPIPGVREEDGSIDNSVCGSGTCAVMLKGTDNKANAWTFMDWFTGKETQVNYGLDIESVLGVAGRYDTANQKAFLSLPWNYEQQQLISKQWDTMFQLEQVPGAYYVERNLTNAFRSVVFNNNNARETLVEYNKVINKEILRKIEEFGQK